MSGDRTYRDRDEVDVTILEALVDRSDGGMTVFELRAAVDEDIDTIETALERLKRDGLITAEQEGNQTKIRPAQRVIDNPPEEPERSMFDELRERLPF